VRSGKNAVHHLLMELFMLDDVGQGYDIAQSQEGRIATTLGRHTSDFLTSFYTYTPSNFLVEYGWGARSIDVDNWVAKERPEGPSMWGHDRVWLPQDVRDNARRMRMKLAEDGYRRPVQVIEGNYELAPGVCPWWDSLKQAGSNAVAVG
jgi:hypothetical protein